MPWSIFKYYKNFSRRFLDTKKKAKMSIQSAVDLMMLPMQCKFRRKTEKKGSSNTSLRAETRKIPRTREQEEEEEK